MQIRTAGEKKVIVYGFTDYMLSSMQIPLLVSSLLRMPSKRVEK